MALIVESRKQSQKKWQMRIQEAKKLLYRKGEDHQREEGPAEQQRTLPATDRQNSYLVNTQQKYLRNHVNSATIHNSAEMEPAWIHRNMSPYVTYVHNGILFSHNTK